MSERSIISLNKLNHKSCKLYCGTEGCPAPKGGVKMKKLSKTTDNFIDACQKMKEASITVKEAVEGLISAAELMRNIMPSTEDIIKNLGVNNVNERTGKTTEKGNS